MFEEIDILHAEPRPAGILDITAGNPPVGFYAWIFNIIAKKAPRRAFGDNIYVVNTVRLTTNIL